MKPRCCGWVNLCPSVSKSRRDGLSSAARALLGSFTQLSLTQASPSLWASSKPVLPPLSAPNSCDVMYCFPSSNKLHQKKETGIFFFFSFLAWRSVSKISAALCPCQEFLSSQSLLGQLPLSPVE